VMNKLQGLVYPKKLPICNIECDTGYQIDTFLDFLENDIICLLIIKKKNQYFAFILTHGSFDVSIYE